MIYAEDIVNKLRRSRSIVIYGARIVAQEVANCLRGAPYNLSIDSFMVSGMEGNPDSLMGIPVIDIYEGESKYRDALVIVAVLEKYMDEILANLNMHGFTDIIQMTFESDLWSDIRGNYCRFLYESQGRAYLTLEEELEKIPDGHGLSVTSHVYVAKCHADRLLYEDTSAYDWETPIQVGAALTDRVISRVQDQSGKNISAKNKTYCELTALYWIWKNDCRSKFAGLCHYRRHFNINKEMLEKLEQSDIDVILTVPILNFPDVRSVYVNDHIEEDWDIMLEAIKKLSPDYFGAADRLQKGNLYYAYNMFIARKWILNHYCEWLFPILGYCEDKCSKKADTYQNRYIGFLAERLMSIYFLYHEDKYKIVHARKHFIWK